MGATLPTLTRTVNLTGQSGNPGDLDPLFLPVQGAAATTLTYGDQGGQPGFSINDTASAIWLMTAVPLAAFHNDPAAPATEVTLEWEQNVSNATTHGGGPFFYHHSNDHYESDGAGYFIRLGLANSAGRLFHIDSDAGTYTQFGADFSHTPATWGRFRATLSMGTTGNLKKIRLEEHVSGAWSDLATYDDINDVGDMFAIAFRSTSDDTLAIRGPGGAMGPIVTFQGPSFVGVVTGQSEFSGRAPGLQANSDQDLYHVTRQGTFVSPMTDPWSGTQTAHATWTGITAENTTPGGSFGVTLATRLKAAYPTQCWNVLAPKGGLSAADYAPPAATSRYLTTNRCGARDLMTTTLAGDGRTPGQRLVHFYWQGTRDANLATTQSAYKADLQAVFDRVNALFPTSDIFLAITGDRLYADPGITTAESQAIRNAQHELILAGAAQPWFDDEQLVGEIGTNTGWNNPGDTLHPGTSDNALLSILADEAFLTRQLVVGSLSGVVLHPNQSFDNTGQSATVPAALGDVDGVTDQSFREALLAYIAGPSTVIDNGDGTKTITYKKQDATTNKLTITFNTAGEFVSTTVA